MSVGLLMAAVGCAHARKGAWRESDVLGIAVAWVTGAAPPAASYRFVVNGSPAPNDVLDDVTERLKLVRVGRELRQGPETPAVSLVTVRAGPIAWPSPGQAAVPVEYVLPDGAVVKCTVLVRPAGRWITSGDRGMECWPRPGRFPGKRRAE